jgi:nucleotide-binding universal stress UspA family protein
MVGETMKILIGYDGSECADAALEDLQRAGLGTDAEAFVMTVADVFVPVPIGEEVENTVPMYIPSAVKRAHERAQHKREEATDLAKQVSEQIGSIFPTWRIDSGAEADSPAWALIRKADHWKPDLIIMGARGHSVFGGRLILGSISQRVLYEARCSVRIARASENNPDKPVRLLIGVDSSADSNAAMEAVCNRHWPKGTDAASTGATTSVALIAIRPILNRVGGN